MAVLDRDALMAAIPQCFVCGVKTAKARLKRFVVLGCWVEEPICRRCWDAPTDEPKEGEWEDVRPSAR